MPDDSIMFPWWTSLHSCLQQISRICNCTSNHPRQTSTYKINPHGCFLSIWHKYSFDRFIKSQSKCRVWSLPHHGCLNPFIHPSPHSFLHINDLNSFNKPRIFFHPIWSNFLYLHSDFASVNGMSTGPWNYGGCTS